MLNDKACLVLHLEGPLQAWGTESQLSHRNTALIPSKSAMTGMICAALGLDRGSQEENELLLAFQNIPMLAIVTPKIVTTKPIDMTRLQDYHTVQNTKTAEGKKKDCHITHRQYLQDAVFWVLFSGSKTILERCALALKNPVWGLWLGRKACIPSRPVYGGFFENESKALHSILDKPLASYTHVREVQTFESGIDSVTDNALSYLSTKRIFSSRRIKTVYAEGE